MKTIQSRICELTGITHPIFRGGMAWVSEAYLAAAVSNAGGLGLIGHECRGRVPERTDQIV